MNIKKWMKSFQYKNYFLLSCLFLLTLIKVNSQPYQIYQTCESGLTLLDQETISDVKVPGTIITLSRYDHHLEVKTLISTLFTSQNYPFFPFNFKGSLDLKLLISPIDVRQNTNFEKVFYSTGLLHLNSVSKPVSVQFSTLPADTELNGEMRLSLVVVFHLSDFFPDEFSGKSVAFVIHNGYINTIV